MAVMVVEAKGMAEAEVAEMVVVADMEVVAEADVCEESVDGESADGERVDCDHGTRAFVPVEDPLGHCSPHPMTAAAATHWTCPALSPILRFGPWRPRPCDRAPRQDFRVCLR